MNAERFYYLKVKNTAINEEEATFFDHAIAYREIEVFFENDKIVISNFKPFLKSFSHRAISIKINLQCGRKGNTKIVRELCKIFNTVWFTYLRKLELLNRCESNCYMKTHLKCTGRIQLLRGGQETLFSSLYFHFRHLQECESLTLNYLPNNKS